MDEQQVQWYTFLISAIGRVGGREEKIYVHEDDKEKDIRKLFFLFFEH